VSGEERNARWLRIGDCRDLLSDQRFVNRCERRPQVGADKTATAPVIGAGRFRMCAQGEPQSVEQPGRLGVWPVGCSGGRRPVHSSHGEALRLGGKRAVYGTSVCILAGRIPTCLVTDAFTMRCLLKKSLTNSRFCANDESRRGPVRLAF